MTGLFSAKRPLVGVVHLSPSLGVAGFPGPRSALAALVADVENIARGGMDGVLIENDNDKPHTLTVSKAQVAWLAAAAVAAKDAVWLPVGIGVQRIDWEASLAVAAAAELAFVRLDVFVDRVRMQGELVEVNAEEVVAYRAAIGAGSVELWTDVHVKHSEVCSKTTLAGSARAAAERGSAVVLVTGTRTGEPPLVADLRAARAAAPAPVFIGSGLTPTHAGVLAAESDGAVVGTFLKDGARVSLARVKEMVEAWRSACASLP